MYECQHKLLQKPMCYQMWCNSWRTMKQRLKINAAGPGISSSSLLNLPSTFPTMQLTHQPIQSEIQCIQKLPTVPNETNNLHYSPYRFLIYHELMQCEYSLSCAIEGVSVCGVFLFQRIKCGSLTRNWETIFCSPVELRSWGKKVKILRGHHIGV